MGGGFVSSFAWSDKILQMLHHTWETKLYTSDVGVAKTRGYPWLKYRILLYIPGGVFLLGYIYIYIYIIRVRVRERCYVVPGCVADGAPPWWSGCSLHGLVGLVRVRRGFARLAFEAKRFWGV